MNYKIDIPIMPGQYVWRVVNDKRIKKPHKCLVTGIWLSYEETSTFIHLAYLEVGKEYSLQLPFSTIGRSVFETEEEALKRIQEKEDKKKIKEMNI